MPTQNRVWCKQRTNSQEPGDATTTDRHAFAGDLTLGLGAADMLGWHSISGRIGNCLSKVRMT